jgi:hypothetical protein
MKLLLKRVERGDSLTAVLRKAKTFEERKHPRGQPGNAGQFAGGGGTGKKEPWDSSTAKAQELKAENWGTPEEIAEMAKMPYEADSFEQAKDYLIPLINKPLANKTGLNGIITRNSMKEILSGNTTDKSFNIKAHLKAAANIDKLFSNAIEKWKFELNPNKNNENLEDRKYLYSPMEFGGKIVPVKIALMIYKDRTAKKRIYAIEAIDVELGQKNRDVGNLAPGVTKSVSSDIPQYPYNKNISHIFDSVNEYLKKSLTYSGHKLAGRYTFAGFNISIENKKGSVRSGKDKDGHEWHSKMHFDYGYIRGTEGVDGDHVDVYIGPNEEARKVYVVHQNDPVTGKYDEDKVMLGFDSLYEAKKAYLKQYDRPGFLGEIDILPLEQFREKALSKKYHGKMVKSFAGRVREIADKDIP